MGQPGLGRKLFLTLLAVGGVAALVSAITFSAFSDTVTTGNNSFEAGTVVLASAGTAQSQFTSSAMKPGQQQQSCLTVSYTGSLAATLRLYATVSGALAQYLTTTIERGTFPGPAPANGSCTGFVKDASNGDIYSGELAALPAQWGTGIADPVSSWTAGDSATYRITVAQNDASGAQGQQATAAFTVEARNT